LPGDVATLAAARHAAGRPLHLPPLGGPGVQQGMGQAEPEVLLVDGATLRVLVCGLCPALDALLALTPSNEGKNLVWRREGRSTHYSDSASLQAQASAGLGPLRLAVQTHVPAASLLPHTRADAVLLTSTCVRCMCAAARSPVRC
jgi:hypothetical protein